MREIAVNRQEKPGEVLGTAKKNLNRYAAKLPDFLSLLLQGQEMR
jgi:hypothetical protein